MERFVYDARTSLRILRRSPGLAISAIVALAMGIGFTTTMFSIVRGGTGYVDDFQVRAPTDCACE